MAQIKLTQYQRNLLEDSLRVKQGAEAAQEELLTMIFAANKVSRPNVQVQYNDGAITWADVIETPHEDA